MSVPAPELTRAIRTTRAALWGLLINLALVGVKLIGGIWGHSYALLADAVESSTDVFASLIVWAGLRVTARPANEAYPFGYGRAEPLVAAVVSFMLLGAALGIAVAAVREIITPHHAPAPFTLAVVAGVVIVKELLFRRVLAVADDTASVAVEADAWHHRSDALTSAAAFVGIAVALWGGPGWEAADDWGALVASGIIAANGVRLVRLAADELMDRLPSTEILAQIVAAAEAVPGVQMTEKLRVRRLAGQWFIDLHVQADPAMSLDAAHHLGGQVKGAIREALTQPCDVLIHMEPHHGQAGE
jgi:cation diffusion facilitator family transporter